LVKHKLEVDIFPKLQFCQKQRTEHCNLIRWSKSIHIHYPGTCLCCQLQKLDMTSCFQKLPMQKIASKFVCSCLKYPPHTN